MTPRPRDHANHEATLERIKNAARSLMVEQGTAGLSLRAIARVVGMSASALYHYFANLDDLITTLILENYNDVADAMQVARDRCTKRSALACLMDVMAAYREWGIANPVDFDLINGNPIPGYHAPAAVTAPAAARALDVTLDLIQAAVDAEEIAPPPAESLPAALYDMLKQSLIAKSYTHISVEAYYVAITGWSQAQGLVALEVHNSIQPLLPDPALFYTHRMQALFPPPGGWPTYTIDQPQ